MCTKTDTPWFDDNADKLAKFFIHELLTDTKDALPPSFTLQYNVRATVLQLPSSFDGRYSACTHVFAQRWHQGGARPARALAVNLVPRLCPGRWATMKFAQMHNNRRVALI